MAPLSERYSGGVTTNGGHSIPQGKKELDEPIVPKQQQATAAGKNPEQYAYHCALGWLSAGSVGLGTVLGALNGA